VGHWILQTSREIKVECLLALISSGGIVVVGSGSTRVVDLVFEIFRFRIRGVEEVVTRNQELRTPNPRSPNRIRTVG
jgi:hypothetical protein